MTVSEYLHFVGKLYEIPNRHGKIDELIERLALGGFVDRPDRALFQRAATRVGLAPSFAPRSPRSLF